MTFVHPMVLWLLLLAVPLAAIHSRRRMALSPVRNAVVVGIRLLAFAALILALARPIVERPDPSRTLVAVVDVSDSIGESDLNEVQASAARLLAERRPEETVRLVTVGQRACAISLPATAHRAVARGTALADGLRLAGAMIPHDGRGRIVLYTDGLETDGDALAAAHGLARRGIGVSAVAVGEPRSGEMVLRSVSTPASAGVGSTVELDARVESSDDAPATLVVRREDDGQETRAPVPAGQGLRRVTLSCPLARQGVARYSIRVESAGDTLADNNTLDAAVFVEPPLNVCVVEEIGGPAAGALAALLGPAANVVQRAPDAPAELENVDLLVLADVPADAIGPEAQQRIKEAVTRGRGLLVTGGRRSFGPGGYAHTPLADVLPVRSTQEVERRDPSTTLVVIIDTSGSMGGPRVNLAKEIARLAISRLKPHDKAGIVEFYGSKRWAAPIQPASNAIDLHRALNRLSSGGGTIILPAIEEAYYALQNVRTRTRHVLVLTDGGVEPGAFEPLIRRMADHGMTVSTVMVGPGGHSAFLAGLAQWGRGRFYAAPDRFNLPEIIVKQPESSLLTPFVEQRTTLSSRKTDPILEGIDLASAPALTGYVETTLRPTADLLVESSLGHPVLARWRYGLGAVAVWTTQIGGEWSNDLARWEPYARMMSGLVRSLSATPAERALAIRPVLRPGAVEVQVENRLPDSNTGSAAIELTATDSSGKRVSQVLDPIAPDRWNLRLADPAPGVWRFDARTQDGRLAGSGAVAVPAAREVSAVGPDRELLGAIDALRPAAAQRATELAGKPAMRPVEVWPRLVEAALFLFVLNVLIRRWPGRGARIAPVAVALLCAWVVPAAPAQEKSDDPESARAAIEKVPADQRDAAQWAEMARLEELLGNDAGAVAAIDRALSTERDPQRLLALQIRQALILYDRPDKVAAADAIRAMAAGRPDEPGVAAFCAFLASLNGNHETTLALLQPSGEAKQQFHEHLFRGLSLTHLDRPAEARREYEQACAVAPLPRDRRFALERILASARESGQLGKLADEWLADRNLSVEHLAALVTVLRELGRSEDAMALVRRGDLTDPQRELVESSEFQSEVIALAVESGRAGEAQAAYRAMLERQPRQVEWRVGLARLRLLDGARDEAAGIFEEGIARFDQPRDLMALADGARRLGLDEAAVRAARKAGTADDAARVRAVLFEADLIRERGDADKAVVLLKELSIDAEDDPNVVLPVAEAFERYGDRQEALRLFRRIHGLTHGEDVLLRVAWLLEENGRFAEACALWKEMWRTTQVPARLRQAQERVLDLASRTGMLADLVIELEEELDRGAAATGPATGDDRALALLIDIYSVANDPVSAAEVLQDYGRGGERKGGRDARPPGNGDDIRIQKRLAQVYLNCEQFGRCNAILRRLVTLDPPNAEDYLQQIAVVALERKQPVEAKAVLTELAARATDRAVADEFSAGVLDMLGLHQEAADAYLRVLAEHPDRIEAFLTWGNAMKAAGQVDRAVARFQTLVETAAEDDLFAVLVDGLLNLSAKPVALRSAYRRVLARIAARPDQVFLYQLGADLLDAMGKPNDRDDLLEQAVIVAGERRGPLLRELMDAARADNKTDRVTRFGRSLLALGEEVPPQVYLDLGEALIKQEQFAQAERVFDRAGLIADFSAVRQRVATYYEEANRTTDADRIIRELLVAEPDNVPLRIRSGGVCEQLGAYDRAFEQYGRAADLIVRRLPRVVRREEAKTKPAEEPKRGRQWEAANLDEAAQYFEAAGDGLLNAARTPAMREKLLNDLEEHVTQELKELTAERAIAPTIEANLRLDRLTSFLRHAAFALHVPDLADRIDRSLIALYPKDAGLASKLVQARVDWGLYSRAIAMQAAGGGVPPPVLTIEAVRSGAKPFDESLPPGGPEAALGCKLVPVLVMTGRDDEARRVLRATKPGPPAEVGDTAATMIAAAVALEDYDALRAWVTIWLDACEKITDAKAAPELERCVRLVWNHLTPGDRTVVVDRLKRLSDSLEGGARLTIDLLRMRLAEGMGVPFEDQARLLAEAAKDETVSNPMLVRLLDAAPAADRPGLLRSMVSVRKPAEVRSDLMAIAGAIRAPADAALVETFETLFKAAPARRAQADRAYTDTALGGWCSNPHQPEIGRRIGEILLAESPNQLPVLVAVAVARENAGLHDEAQLLVREAVDLLLGQTDPQYQQARMWDELAATLRPQDCGAVVNDLNDRVAVEGVTVSLLYGKGAMLLRMQRREEAVEAIRAAFRLAPENRIISRKLVRLLQEGGQELELSRLLAATLTKSSLTELVEWRTLSVAYCSLYDPVSAAAAARKLEGTLAAMENIRVARLLGRVDDVRTMLRRFLIANRNQGRFFNLVWPDDPSPGGLTGYLAARNVDRSRRPTLFVAVADLPFAEEEFASLLTAAAPDRRDVPGFIDALVKATQVNGTRQALVAGLVEAQRNNALTAKDRRMILALLEETQKRKNAKTQKEEAEGVPQELADSLDSLLVHLDITEFEDQRTLWAIARLHRAGGRMDQARNILRWLVAHDLASGRSTTWINDLLDRLDEYLALVPQDQREAQRRRWTALQALTPLDPLDGGYVSALLDRWGDLGDTAQRDSLVTALRTRLEADPSKAGTMLYAAIARCEAAAGRFDAFAAMARKAVEKIDDRNGWEGVPLDGGKLLPAARNLDNPARYMDEVVSQVEAARQAGTISPEIATRGLCLLGNWCVQNGLTDAARALLTRAQAGAGPPGETSLWLADLARLAGEPARATEIETALLEMDRLPVVRVPALLDAVEARKDRAAADALAVRVAAYSDHPAVLERAIRAATAAGDETAAAAYRKRLAVVRPDPKRP